MKLLLVPDQFACLRAKQEKLGKVDAAFAVGCESLDVEPRRRRQLFQVVRVFGGSNGQGCSGRNAIRQGLRASWWRVIPTGERVR